MLLDDARGWTFRPRHRVQTATEDARRIERQKLRFNWSNLRVMNVALSDLDRKMSLSRQRIGDGSATLEVSRRRSADATLTVQVTKLDTIADEIFSKLKFIKCDVEGHERNVFLGGEQTIRRYRPVVQFVRFTDQRTQDIFQFSAVSDTQACFY